ILSALLPSQLCSARPSTADLPVKSRAPPPPRLASSPRPLRKVRSLHTPGHAHSSLPPLLLLPALAPRGIRPVAWWLAWPGRGSGIRVRRDRAGISRRARDLLGSRGNGLPACGL
ncbi:hypothetical protein BS78_03G131700, partial [Paspalum vaginatum]